MRYYITIDGVDCNYIGYDLNAIGIQVQLRKFYDTFGVWGNIRKVYYGGGY